jgi:cephalosporin-C deacetylase-like acetyl esterase
MFDYKEENLTGFEVITSIAKEGFSIRDVRYESPFNGAVPAFLFLPYKAHSLPTVVFMHHGRESRESFFHEAELLATKGFVSLLIEAPFLRENSQPELPGKEKFTKRIEGLADIQKYIQTVMDIRRGVTLLCRLACVDEDRIAYVGYSFGATWGGVLAGIENRIKTFVLMSGYGEASEWYMSSEHPMAALIRSFLPPERFEYFISNLRKLDAIHYIKNAAPASVFFQFAENDEFINQDQATSFFTAASSPKKIIWYNTDHQFTNCAAALYDRQEWLFEQIGSRNGVFSRESTKK